MPERLLSVISGILAGGIPGFRIELCCFYHPFAWPPCGSVFVLFSFFFGGHTHYDTQDVIVHVFLIAGSDPFSPCFFLFVCLWLFLFVFACFVCLSSFVCGLVFGLFSCWDSSLDCVQVQYQHFGAIDKMTALHENYNSSAN